MRPSIVAIPQSQCSYNVAVSGQWDNNYTAKHVAQVEEKEKKMGWLPSHAGDNSPYCLGLLFIGS